MSSIFLKEGSPAFRAGRTIKPEEVGKIIPGESPEVWFRRVNFTDSVFAEFNRSAGIVQSSQPVAIDRVPGDISELAPIIHTTKVEYGGEVFEVTGPIRNGRFAGGEALEITNLNEIAAEEDREFWRNYWENGPDI